MTTDIAVTTQTFLPADRPWLLFEAQGLPGPVPTDFGIIDFSLFTANTHYPDGFLPSGLVLGRVTTGGRLGPYSDAASDGRQTAVGFLYNAVAVPAGAPQARKVAVAVADAFVIVAVGKLPANHGLDANGRADLPLVKFRA